MSKEKGVIVVYNDEDAGFARVLFSYLLGIEGRTFSLRSDKYGCDPRLYRHVIRIGKARLEPLGLPNIIECKKPPPYKEAKARSSLYEYTLKIHNETYARDAADSLKQRILR